MNSFLHDLVDTAEPAVASITDLPFDEVLSARSANCERHARGALIFRPGRFMTPFLIVSGALRVDAPGSDDSTVRLALPGDLLGLEQLSGRPQSCYGRAIVETIVAPVGPMPDSAWRELLVRRLLVQQAHVAQLGRLRYGPAPERIRALLLALTGWLGPDARRLSGPSPVPEAVLPVCELPRLNDMASITDTTPETVSRVVSSMRRSGLIEAAGARRVRLSEALVQAACALPKGMTRSRTTVDADD